MEKMVEYKKPVINGTLTTHEQQAPLKEWLDLIWMPTGSDGR